MFRIKTPTDCISYIKKSIHKEEKLAFLSTIMIGFFCHLFIFTNSMYNNDDIRYLYVDFDKPELGRWLQTYAAGITSYYSMPVVNGILALLYIGFTSIVLVKIFELKNHLNIILVSGLLVTFPTVACLYSYMFASDPFMLSMLLSTLAAYFVTRTEHKWYWIPGAVCLCCSVGIYQAYLPFTLVLMLLFFVLMLLSPEKYSDTLIFKTAIRYLIMLFTGMLAYYIGMTITIKLKHTVLSDYQGIGESSVPGFSEIRQRILNVFQDFIDFFRSTGVLRFNSWMKLAVILTGAALLICFLVIYIKEHVYQNPTRNLWLIFCLICIPPSVNVIYFISDGVIFHMLMRHTWCLLFISIAIFSEKAAPYISITKRALLEWTASLTMLLVVWNYILLSNISYFNMNFRYEKTYSLCLKIREHLESSEDFDKDRPIAFIGRYSKVYKDYDLMDFLEPMTGTNGAIIPASGRAYLAFFQNCLGEDYTIVTDEDADILSQTQEFQDMPRFPKEGSIQVINGVTVVKLND